MKIDNIIIKNNQTFPNSIECTVEMSDDLGICYAYTMTNHIDAPNRVVIDKCVDAILNRYVKVVTDRYFERVGL